MARALASKRLAGHAEAAADTARAVAAEVGSAIRRAGRAALAEALRASRADTLALAARYQSALPDLAVPLHPDLNPPLWELGHIGWFQDWWLGRFSARLQGPRADPDAPRLPPLREGADALYDSSRVPHDRRWSLPLPDLAATRDDLAAQLERSLALLADGSEDDDALYCFRLVLLHEDMHHEAALYSAQALDIAVDDPRWQPPALPQPGDALDFDAGRWTLGLDGPGFAFDNELVAHPVALAACRIDSQVLRWADYLPFVESGGYRQSRWWTEDGRRWLAHHQADAPRYLRRQGGQWQRRAGGRWLALDPDGPACHLSAHEARAWCEWAGRRLPTEAEWERAAVSRPDAFHWGAVWEWTASPFAPYPGFSPHPYRDYSAPWFGSRPVLRGASFGTQPRMRHPRYRNYFMAGRNDIFAGFRSCAR